jgi:hypothetical protein
MIGTNHGGFMRHAIMALLLLCSVDALAQRGRLITNPLRNIPRWVRTEFTNRNLDDRYNIIFELFPYTLQGDFNGDGRRDVAIQIQDKKSGKNGIAIFHGKRTQVISTPITILGAGNDCGKAGTDFQWINLWNIIKHRDLVQQFGKNRPSEIEGDVITIAKRDSIGGIIYWDGRKYTYTIQR